MINRSIDSDVSGDSANEKVRMIFEAVARRYDLANRVLSFSMDMLWRRKAVSLVAPVSGERVLDMCCGTGDMGFCFAQREPGLEVILGCDLSEKMLEIARRKESGFAEQGGGGSVKFEWIAGDCGELELGDGSFDVVSCVFGIRNTADYRGVLRRMHSLLGAGGRVCIVEFSLPERIFVRRLYLLYLIYVLPLLGFLVTGRLGEYRYLAKSVQKWSREVDLPAEMHDAGFSHVTVKRLSFGVASIYLAYK